MVSGIEAALLKQPPMNIYYFQEMPPFGKSIRVTLESGHQAAQTHLILIAALQGLPEHLRHRLLAPEAVLQVQPGQEHVQTLA